MLYNVDNKTVTIVFDKKVDLFLVNSLRRIILADIPTYAFDNFEVISNNSPFEFDYISKRIGLIPITSGNETGDDRSCELNVSAEDPVQTFKSDNIKCSHKDVKWNKNIDVVLLKSVVKEGSKKKEKESVHIKFGIKKGTPRTDAKFACVTVASCYSNKKDPNKIELMFEARGNILPNGIFLLAINTFREKVDTVLSALNTPESLKLIMMKDGTTSTTFRIEGEDDTIAYPLQRILIKKYPDLTVSYRRPDPLKYYVELKIFDERAEEMFKEALEELDQMLKNLKKNN